MQIVHVVSHYVYLVLAYVGIYIALVQQWVLIVMLFGHTQYSSHCLNGKLVARQLSENEQHCSPWAIPTQGNGLFEQQHLGHVVVILQSFKVRLLVRQPDGKTMVVGVYAFYHVEILPHLVHYLCVLGGQRFLCVVRQLYQQQGIDVRTLFPVCLGYLVALLQCLLYKVDV